MAKRNGKSNMRFMGWRRENGRVGVRNHVVILPLDDLSNAACEAVANNIKGTLAIPHAYGRLQFGEDLETFFRTIIGTGCNPNVAAAVVIGIEEGWTKRIVDGIKKTGKPVTGLPVFLMPSTMRLVQSSSMPITTTAATFGFDPVPISVRKNRSRSSPNCRRP